MSHDHRDPGRPVHGDARYLSAALILIVAFMVVEVVASVLSHSLALLSDAGHMVVDAMALTASLVASRWGARPPRGPWTYGFRRAEILSAAVNGVTLLVIAVAMAAGAVERLWHPVRVLGGAVIVVALVGVVVNAAAAWILSRADRSSLNVRGSLRHVLTDLYGFLATAVAGGVILTTHFERADAIATLFVVALMLRAAWSLLGASGRILLEAAPENVDLEEMRRHLVGIDQVVDVHDLHVWTVSSGLPVLSAHVVVDDAIFTTGAAPRLLDALQSCLTGHFDVAHSTFQLEPSRHRAHEGEVH
jgi:cobalt-zinc-cadmium efflux system protein